MAVYAEPWFITIMIGIVALVIAIIGYIFYVSDDDIPLWIWIFAVAAGLLIVLSLILFIAQASKKKSNEFIIVTHKGTIITPVTKKIQDTMLSVEKKCQPELSLYPN